MTASLTEHGIRAARVALGLAGVLALLGALSALSGCGASRYQMQARAVRLTTITTGATGDVVDAARDHALDAVEAAHPVHGPERTAALEAEAARWRPAGQTLDALREVLISWALAVEAAHAVGEDGASALWPRVLALAGQAAALYGRVASLARELGAEGVPELPGALTALLGGGEL